MDLVGPNLLGSDSSGTTLSSETHLPKFAACFCLSPSIDDGILVETVGKTCRYHVHC